MKTDTGAAGAKEDAHMLLATAGAGVSTMVHYFGEGGDANLATAQSMELPMVKASRTGSRTKRTSSKTCSSG
jgi:hypothetical protein